MNALKKHLDNLFKEIEHGDEQHRKWLRDKFDSYIENHEDDDDFESEFVDKLIDELPEYGIDTSKWEYEHGENAYSAVEFLARCIESNTSNPCEGK